MKEMKEKKTDHRTKYTKMVIRDAFQMLLKKKPIQKITIADICSAAEISRPTFYAHYEDIYALLDEIGENLLASANLREVTNLSIEKQAEEVRKVKYYLNGIIRTPVVFHPDQTIEEICYRKIELLGSRVHTGSRDVPQDVGGARSDGHIDLVRPREHLRRGEVVPQVRVADESREHVLRIQCLHRDE